MHFDKRIINWPPFMNTVYDVQVGQVATIKSLGVITDDKLDWSGNIEKLAKKIACGIMAIKRQRHLSNLTSNIPISYTTTLPVQVSAIPFGETVENFAE